ncbi:MAG: hypothetical protein IJ589_06985 [Lachnospiraceae bacterium]|nr:hypothetical protein [Lachnospiraceae bacterium]
MKKKTALIALLLILNTGFLTGCGLTNIPKITEYLREIGDAINEFFEQQGNSDAAPSPDDLFPDGNITIRYSDLNLFSA